MGLFTATGSRRLARMLRARRAMRLALVAVLLCAASSEAVTLTWTDNSTGETGQEIERCQGTNCTSFTLLTTVAANITIAVDTTALERTTYCYRIRAIATGVPPSGYSNVSCVTTGLNGPTGLIATPQ